MAQLLCTVKNLLNTALRVLLVIREPIIYEDDESSSSEDPLPYLLQSHQLHPLLYLPHLHLHLHPRPPPLPAPHNPVPILNVAPVIPLAPLAQPGNTQAINAAMVAWLLCLYGRYPIVIEIRGTNKRDGQAVAKLLEWCEQVHKVRNGYTRVPNHATTAGVAVGHLITRTNISEVFLCSVSWIKIALETHALYQTKKDLPQVEKFVALGHTMGLAVLFEQLSAL
ncbi:hypothetical protein C8R43DRAFT_942170 [Mycena crocata]|nr:hypothetical protein C8R43DRAFT_942170 [Mycena crocata]